VFEAGIWSGNWTSTQWTPVSANQCNYWTGNSTCLVTAPKTYVQTTSGNIGGCTTCALTAFSGAVGVGNAVVGVLFWNNSTPQNVTSVTDDKGNTYTLGPQLTDAPHTFRGQTFWRGNITNGPTTITATFSGPNGGFLAKADEYSGAAALTDPSDGNTGQLQAGPAIGADTITSGNITTTTTNDLIWGATAMSGSQTIATVGTGFTGRGSVAGYILTEDKNLPTATTTAATFNQVAVNSTLAWVVAIK